jgi:hypothetical protein
MIIYNNIIQGSKEWDAVRAGKLTGSKATAIANAGAGLKTLVTKIIEESIFPPNPNDRFESEAMKRGTELESAARIMYEFDKGVEVRQVGFVQGDGYHGFSPDGLVDDDGGIEAKCRDHSKHLHFLRGGKIDSGTLWQIQFSLKVSGRKWWDFISYNPDFHKSLHVERFYPMPDKFAKIEAGIIKGTQMLKDGFAEEVVRNELFFTKQVA